MIRHTLAGACAALAVLAGCGVGVDPAPRPLEPVGTTPLQPTPTVVERPDDRPAGCPPTLAPPAPTPTAGVPTSTPSSAPTPSPAPTSAPC